MSYKGGKKPGRGDQWGSVESITDRAMNDIDDDQASLHDYFMMCKRYRPDVFRNWTIEQFSRWNHERIEKLTAPEVQADLNMSGTMRMANKVLFIVIQELGGVPDQLIQMLIDYKKALVEEYEAAPSDQAARLMYAELKSYAAGQGLRVAGQLTPAAKKELAKIRKQCQQERDEA